MPHDKRKDDEETGFLNVKQIAVFSLRVSEHEKHSNRVSLIVAGYQARASQIPFTTATAIGNRQSAIASFSYTNVRVS